jgi:hypothetical protein
MSCNTNVAPVAQSDSVVLCVSETERTATVNVLANDADMENNNIFLTSANFVNQADTALATLTVSAADSIIILELKPSANIGAGHLFDIIYNIKDNGLPASQCATGSLKIKTYPRPKLSSTLTPPTICSGATFSYTAESMVADVTFSWSRAAITDIEEPASSGNGANIGEVLTDTTADSVTVIYLVTLTTEYCQHVDTVKVTVYAPLKGGIIGTAQTYCSGILPAIYLGTASATGGNGNYTYQWENSTNNGNTWTNLGTTQIYALAGTFTQTTLYRRVVIDNACGTGYSDTIAVHPVPFASVNITDLCVGTWSMLSPYLEIEGKWTSNDTNIAQIIDNNKVIGKADGQTILSFLLYSTGCTNNIPITISEVLPANEITGKNVVCINEVLQLTNQTTGGIWSVSNNNITITDPNANPVTITGVAEGQSFVTYTIGTGNCQTKRTFRVKVISNTPPTIIIGIER